ncbi:MAG: S41 family peptidase [Sphingobacteriales bacterium]|nr:MAG: S41 family peptidase [Sphingobacteriales bacterium]
MNKAFYPLFFAIILASGVFLGYKLQDRNSAKYKQIGTSGINSKLDYILQLIDAKYVDTVDVNKLYDEAINGILEKLDPHSMYLPPIESQQEAEIMEGNFEGIGIEFLISKDTIQVVNTISGGPAEQVGMSAGDKIIKINDTLVAGNGITNEVVMKKLKGPKGTKVSVTVLKRNKKMVTYSITRNKIPINSVDAGFMLNSNTGYIKINRFSKNTYFEFAEKLDMLSAKGMKNLILDLRGNGGGFMDQAIKITDEFLDGKKLIVYTKGKNSPKIEENAGKIGNFEQGNLAILIDEGSASASEIVSGAIQDWDRGTIIGRRSFGKGLVQEEIPFTDGSALRLTVARYYTPSGRSIQRDYQNGSQAYYEDVNNRFKSNGEAYALDSTKHSVEKYKTKVKGRTVFGGGGIEPDIFVPIDTSMYNPLVNEVLYNSILNEFSYIYYQNIKNNFNYTTFEDYNQKFNISDDVYKQFLNFAYQNGVNKKWNNFEAASRPYLSNRLKAYIAKQKWQMEGLLYILSKDDKMIEKALKTF